MLNPKSQTSLIQVVVLVLIALASFLMRLFSVLRYESVIHEFDPWFNYRSTQILVNDGFYSFLNWFDSQSWYPLGRVVGGTVYPGLMMTSALIHNILHYLHIPIDIRNICVMFAPLFSGLTSLSAFLLTRECKDSTSGLFAALFMGIAPGYISRSVAGSYDNEGISIFLLVITFYLWIKAIKMGSMLYGLLTAMFYFYMVSSWGGYVYIINVIPLHTLTLIVMGRYSNKLYIGYSTFYSIGTLASMQVPFVGFQPLKTNDHMAALGVFGLIQLVAFSQYIKLKLSATNYRLLITFGIGSVFVVCFGGLVVLTTMGYIAPWTGRFYSLWDTEYAKKYIPIIASVSEHQPTPWSSMFFDLQTLMVLFPVGLYYCFKLNKDEHVFVIIYALTASYFAGVMVRLVLTLTPIVCVCSGIALSNLLEHYIVTRKTNGGDTNQSTVDIVCNTIPNILTIGVLYSILLTFVKHSTWVTSSAYSSPSIVLSGTKGNGEMFIIDDFREAYYWLRQNTKSDAKVLAWWDYGYQIAGMSNRTTIVDNNTWNNTHIATVGKVMSCNENKAYETLLYLDADYVLVIFGGLIGYSGDDINKFLWMVRIGQGVYPNDINEQSFFTTSGEFRIDDAAPKTFKESVMYKLSYYRFHDIYGGNQAIDRVRGSAIVKNKINLYTMDEAFTSQNWIVRIYKVKEKDFLGRVMKDAHDYSKNKMKLNKAKRYI